MKAGSDELRGGVYVEMQRKANCCLMNREFDESIDSLRLGRPIGRLELPRMIALVRGSLKQVLNRNF
jgi:hypothetical protein